MDNEAKPTVTLRAVADRIGICYETARRWARDGRLPVFKLNGRGHWRAYPEDVDKYIEAHKNQAASWSESN